MLYACDLHYDWSIHTASLAFAQAQRCGASSVIPKPASCSLSGAEKNTLRRLRHGGAGVLRPQGASGARPLLWRYAGLPGDQGPARMVSALWGGEAREGVLAGRQPLLYQTLRLLCRAAVSHGYPPRDRKSTRLN